MPTLDSQTIELAFIAIATLALILQTIFLIVLTTTISKSARSALEEIENLRSSVMPVIYKTREIITRISPKIEEAADELTALTRSLHAQTADVQVAANEVIGRVQRITARLDAMASTVLDSVERAAEFMTDTVAKPMRQITGVVASVRAIVDALRTVDDSPRSQHAGYEPVETRSSEPQSTEKDMFV
jgi:methyl-accepting chemotaxis protein